MIDSTDEKSGRIVPFSTRLNKPQKVIKAKRYANVVYIAAAIQQATGIKLKLPEVVRYLLEEGLISERESKNLIFNDYDNFFAPNGNPKLIEIPKPVDKIVEEEVIVEGEVDG